MTMSPLNRQEHDAISDSEHSTMSLDSIIEELREDVATIERRKVRFSHVEVREFDRVVGDHPDVRVGPPIALGWEHEDLEPVPLNEYERSRISKGVYRLTSITRKNLLINVYGIPEEEIREAEREVQRIRDQRTNTSKQSKPSVKAEAFAQSAKRKLKRRFSKEKWINVMAHSHQYLMPLMAVQ
jgi:hypothetical protein